MNIHRLKDIVDSALLLAILSAGMYFGGRVYYESYYIKLGVPPEIPKHEASSYLMASWDGIAWIVMLVLLAAVFRAGYHDILPARIRANIRKSGRQIPRVAYAGLWAIPLLALCYGVQRMSERGKTMGQKRLDSAMKVEFKMTEANRIELYQYLTACDDAYFVTSASAPEKTILVPKSIVSTVTFLNTRSNDTSK